MIDRGEGKQIHVVGDKVEEVERGVRAREQGSRGAGLASLWGWSTGDGNGSRLEAACKMRSPEPWFLGDGRRRISLFWEMRVWWCCREPR